MRILITGALGHIGSALIHSIKPGEFSEVILLDNLSTQRYVSLFHLPQNVPFRFIEGDILAADLIDLLKDVQIVIHLAAITNAEGSFAIQEQVEAVNYNGTVRIADACCKTGTKMVMLSTTSVYGTQQETVDELCPESDLRPQSPYAKSKLEAERYLMQLNNSLSFTICRFGTIFGCSPGMRFHTAVNKFIWQAVNGLPITVWRTAFNQKRPYLSVSDSVRAIKFIMLNDVFKSELYNILTLNASVSEILAAIQKAIPRISITYVDSPIMNQLSYNVSNEKFKRLGFVYSGSLDDEVSESITWLSGIRATT